MTVRAFRHADAAEVHRVFVRAVREGAAGHYAEAERLAWAPVTELPASWPGWLAGMATFVAEQDGRIAGFMALARDGLLDMAFVLPERMGTGVAGALHDRVLTEARALGLTRLRTEASHLARSFFLRRGWVEEARQEVVKQGVRLTNFRMYLDL